MHRVEGSGCPAPVGSQPPNAPAPNQTWPCHKTHKLLLKPLQTTSPGSYRKPSALGLEGIHPGQKILSGRGDFIHNNSESQRGLCNGLFPLFPWHSN